MKLLYSHVTAAALWGMLKETMRDKSLMRMFMNNALKELTVTGAVLDLGSKSSAMSYNRFLKRDEQTKIQYTDLNEEGEGIVTLDLEKSFPLTERSYETVTCFNTLEHIYNYDNVVHESYRILKHGGTFIGATPFLVNYHPDPHDYFRYTDESIELIFEKVGFKTKKIFYLGLGPFTASLAMQWFVWPCVVRAFVLPAHIFLDMLILKFKKNQRGKYPLGYVFIFEK